MNYLFDISSIFHAITNRKVGVLSQQQTIELARYEIGNIIWKHNTLLKTINMSQAQSLITKSARIFDQMQIHKIPGNESKILQLSIELSLPYYDSAYLYFAQQNESTLVTEDKKMRKKAEKLGIPLASYKELM